MDAEDRIQEKIATLLKARNLLLNQQPTDMVAVAHITEMIVDLSAQLQALTQPQRAMVLTPAEVAALQAAIAALNQSIAQSAAVSQIMASASALLHA